MRHRLIKAFTRSSSFDTSQCLHADPPICFFPLNCISHAGLPCTRNLVLAELWTLILLEGALLWGASPLPSHCASSAQWKDPLLLLLPVLNPSQSPPIHSSHYKAFWPKCESRPRVVTCGCSGPVLQPCPAGWVCSHCMHLLQDQLGQH